MPPLGAYGTESGLAHHPSQQQTVLTFCLRDDTLPDQLLLPVYIGLGAEMVYRRTHRELVATGISQRYVYRQSEIMQSAPLAGFAT